MVAVACVNPTKSDAVKVSAIPFTRAIVALEKGVFISINHGN